MIQLDDGILITPGVPIEKIVEAYESAFGAVRERRWFLVTAPYNWKMYPKR